MKTINKTEEILINSARALRLLAEQAIKVKAPNVFIKHLAEACNEINNAYEIYKYGNDNKTSN